MGVNALIGLDNHPYPHLLWITVWIEHPTNPPERATARPAASPVKN
jgi:hypothetical protein